MSSKKKKIEKHVSKESTKKIVVLWIGILFLLLAVSIVIGLAVNGTIQDLIAKKVLNTSGIVLVSVMGAFGVIGIIALISSFFIKGKKNETKVANVETNEMVESETQEIMINNQQPMQQIQQPTYSLPQQMQQIQQPTYSLPQQQNGQISNSRVPIYRVNPQNQMNPQQRVVQQNMQNNFRTVIGPNGRPVIRRVAPTGAPMPGQQPVQRVVERPEQPGQPPRIVPRPQNSNNEQ